MNEKQLDQIEKDHLKALLIQLEPISKSMKELNRKLDAVRQEYQSLLDDYPSTGGPDRLFEIGKKFLQLRSEQIALAEAMQKICDT